MAKLRRFTVDSLRNLKPGDTVNLPEDQARHALVLRVESGATVALFDLAGFCATARLDRISAASQTTGFVATVIALGQEETKMTRLYLAVAWPKGKRAAVLVEKCTELGVDKIIPLRCVRSVVHKGDESQGLVRLRRIAVEAAKQCQRNDIPEITAAMPSEEVFALPWPQVFPVLLDPAGPLSLPEVILKAGDELQGRPVLLIVGPEGGFAPAELEAAARAGVPRARMARHVLRVETAAVAACAIARGLLDCLGPDLGPLLA